MEWRFDVERTLGRLAKWLRLLGFDTRYPADRIPDSSPELNERILLTRTQKVYQRQDPSRCLLIVPNDWFGQLQQVIQSCGIPREAVRPFSRCLHCNAVIAAVDKRQVYGRVPDYIWETQDHFTVCAHCRRIFWRGSHLASSMEKIERLFSALPGAFRSGSEDSLLC